MYIALDFVTRKRYSDPYDQAVVKKFVVEAKGMDASVTTKVCMSVLLTYM